MEKSTSAHSGIDKTTSAQGSEHFPPNTCQDNNCLPYFISSMFVSIIEDTVTQLRILDECNNELRIHKTWSDMPLHVALKFGVEQLPITDELESIDPHKLTCMAYKLDKLDADRKLVTNTFVETYQDLTIDKTYSTLLERVNKTFNLDDHREFLKEDEAKNRVLRRELCKQIRQQRNHIKTVIYDTDVTIDDLKTQVEDAQLYSECRSRYVENWQRARTEQHVQIIKEQEIKPSETIEYYKQRADHEHRVHSEVEMLTNVAINETMQNVENWMDKYDTDMEKIDLKIQIKKNEYHDMYENRIRLEKTIAKHDQLMKDWIHFKEEREKARLYREKMTTSAIIVQAWWRGLLVRRQLGPYKVSKKKGGKKK
ncbi:unnamed protein product [Chilo suppressalis]|uniref:Dynein regulatory complex protein 9 n=1 Tax=Chilo suppressalis TaxID=168631 RepID=A0ABN8L5I8_CHISP|nr:unnamed protein product [Chilo suppressalis]